MDELLAQFVVEGRELVQQASDDLLALERAPGDRALLDRLFRCVHTLKGSAGIFGFAPMTRALHAAEDLLDTVRRGNPAEGGATPARAQFAAVLDVVGRCDDWIEAVAAGVGSLPADAEAESARLVAVLAGTTRDAAAATAEALPDWAAAFRDAEAPALAAALAAGSRVTLLRYAPAPDCFYLGDDPLALVRAIPELIALRLDVTSAGGDYEPFRCGLVAVAACASTTAELKAIFRLVADQVAFAPLDGAPVEDVRGGRAGAAPSDERSGSLRVASARVDELIEGLGELLAAKTALAELLRHAVAAEPSLAGPAARTSAALDRQVAEAHHRALRLRLVPLAHVFGRLPRLVREIAAGLGKSVDLTVAGDGSEIDKGVADRLFEPLLHLLRNAIDHGIEDAQGRSAAGKPPTGRIHLAAEAVAQGVAITVSDDGGGIDEARVRETAVRRGLLDRAAGDALDRTGTFDLLFQPGFSTAQAVTAVSGRGVGLDAVRASLAAVGGTIALDSEPGRGSTFRLLLPQRAAMVAVMVVRAGGERWGVPSDAVREVLRPKAGALVAVNGGRALVHRGRTLPVLGLASLVGTPDGSAGDDDRRILVARIAAEDVGLAVAAIEGREDVLLRPAAGLLAASPVLRGTAVLGDGGVLMVLDLERLAS